MVNALLLSGPPGCGKTTLVRQILAHLSVPAAGFYTQELRQGGKRLGFELVTLDGRRALLSHVELQSRVRIGAYGVDLDALERVGVTAVRSALEKGCLAVIDEIGPMEIASPLFRKVVEQVLSTSTPLLGTIHYRGGDFIQRIKSRADIHLIMVTPENRNTLCAELLPMVQTITRRNRIA